MFFVNIVCDISEQTAIIYLCIITLSVVLMETRHGLFHVGTRFLHNI